MHVMFIHPNFPGQFGHIAYHLAAKLNWPCTVVSSIDTSRLSFRSCISPTSCARGRRRRPSTIRGRCKS